MIIWTLSRPQRLSNRSLKCLLLLLAICFPVVSLAASPVPDEILDLSLQDLMSLTINTVTKKEEEIQKAPGIVSVLTRAEINRLGVDTVAEAVAFLPGIHQFESYYGAFNQFTIRGNQAAEHYNSKWLLLVNGHPYFQSFTGSSEVNAVPLKLIERIELLRGPMSVFYGTNALSGVINIITRPPADGPNTELTLEAGSFKTGKATVTQTNSWGKWQYRVTAHVRDQKGYLYKIRPDQDERGIASSHYYHKDMQHIAFDLRNQNWTINASAYKIDQPANIGLIPTVVFSIDKMGTDAHYLDIKYEKKISDQSKFTWVTRYDSWREANYGDNANLVENAVYGTAVTDLRAMYYNNADKFGLETYLALGDFSKRLDILVGSSFDVYFNIHNKAFYIPSGIPSRLGFHDDKSNSDFAVYGSADYAFGSDATLTAGIRYTHNRVTGSNVRYKTSLVGKLSANTSYKLLLGTSYRSGSGAELFLNTAGVILGDTSLKPEILTGFDAQLHRVMHTYAMSATYFYNETDDFIDRVPSPLGPKYANVAGTQSQGLEFEFKYYPTKKRKFTGNATYIFENKDKANNSDVLSPSYFVNLGMVHLFMDEKLVISAAARWVGSWGEADGYALINAKVSYQSESNNGKPMIYFLEINNAFDKRYEWAEFSRRNIDTIPGGPPLAVNFGISKRL